MSPFDDWFPAPGTRGRIYRRITTSGIPVRRGLRSDKGGKPYATDPGDFGRGVYYTTNFHRAKQHGDVTKSVLRLKNPIVLTDQEAYRLAVQFNTIVLTDEDYARIRGLHLRVEKMLENAMELTRYFLNLGHDGVVCIHKRGELEIVDFSPYIITLFHNMSAKGLWSRV